MKWSCQTLQLVVENEATQLTFTGNKEISKNHYYETCLSYI